jgi:two-component system sensor histidine kinase DesK
MVEHGRAEQGWGTPREAMWLLTALLTSLLAFTGASVVTGFGQLETSDAGLGLVLLGAIGALQFRHSLAASRGDRPRHWQLTLVMMLALAYLPAAMFTHRWLTTYWYVIASAFMLLPRWPAAFISVATVAAWTAFWVAYDVQYNQAGALGAAWEVVWLPLSASIGGLGLFTGARLVRILSELRETKADLAEIAVGRERLRISRDLHDVLGRTLAAVSLKGDLALRLLERGDRAMAAAEIAGIAALASTGLRDVREVTAGGRRVAFTTEVDEATQLLAAAGIEAQVEKAGIPSSSDIDELFGWAVREGVTNVLRHSDATTCAIRVQQGGGRFRLEMVNDGAAPERGDGFGLIGLASRAATLRGYALGRATGDGDFRLIVDVPAGAS